MTQFIRDKAANSEAQQKKALSYLFAQDSTGLASDGVLTGLTVTQTTTATASVNVAAGAAVVQDSAGNGASLCVSDTQETVDVLGANPMGGTPRNDLIVFDSGTLSSGTGGIRVIVGTPNAVPSDPAVPATAVALARIRNVASATTVDSAHIDNLIVPAHLNDGRSATKANKRFHWGTFNLVTDSNGQVTITHGCGFTPTVVVGSSNSSGGRALGGVDNITSTQCRLTWWYVGGSGDGGVVAPPSGNSFTAGLFFGE